MPLPPGSRLGIYDVIGLIGAGGMGEVYRARDTRLGRDVAVKVLPEVVGADPERVARFEREARTLATLNHPNIAAIHGLEEFDAAPPGRRPATALILELVEGETLADRLKRGPLPLDDALAVAEQMADALGAAHEKGIIHRDLKPANVKITPGGVVKVLDFGLARMTADSSPDLETMMQAATGTGVVLGTPAYMAPEQAQGRTVDKRADVWAFGVVLYEMLAGRRPFGGLSREDTVDSVLTSDPDWECVPPEVRPLLRRCLERDSRRRLRDVGDFRFLIDAGADGGERSASSRRPRVNALLAAASAAALGIAVWGWLRPLEPLAERPVRLTAALPPDVSVMRGVGLASSVAVSPDGRTLVVAGTGAGGQQLYARPIDRLEASPIPGTERASSPFFSWDGAWIGFVADGRLKRVPASGGAAVDIATLSGFPTGASWGPDDRIVFAAGAYGQLMIVDATGGHPEVLTDVSPAYRPQVLPDATVLFESGHWIHVLDRATGRRTRLVQGTAPGYAAGRLILSRGTALLAAPMDLSRHELTGPLVPVVEGVAAEPGTIGGMRHYAISRGGSLAYVPATDAYALVVVREDGTERILADGQRLLQNPQFSPDGRRVAVAAMRRGAEPLDVWIHELASGTATRLTFDGGSAPIWMPDGLAVTYRVSGEAGGIYAKRADGRGEARQLAALDTPLWLVGWTPDGRTLVYGTQEGTPSSIVALEGGRSRRVLGPGHNWGGRLSRDGRWLAYYTRESGSFEVFVTPFPDGGTRWLVADGSDPAWGPDGTALYYRSGTRLMAAQLDTSAGIRVLSHRVVIEPFLPPLYDDYDIHPDGRTLVFVRPSSPTQLRETIVVVNWFTELGS